MNPRLPFRSASRADARTVAERRQWWLMTLEKAAQTGDAAAAGAALAKNEAVIFAGLVVRCAETPFPLPQFQASAADACAGFQRLARGFVAAAQPELRAALGQAMAGAARCCRRIIELDVDAQAAAWRRQHPGEE